MPLNAPLYHCVASYCLTCAVLSLPLSVLAAPLWHASLYKPVQEITFHLDIPNQERVAKAQQIETFKMDGLTGNRAHIPEMIEALKVLQPIEKQYTAWMALSRLGAIEAVPAMNAALKLVYYSPNTELGEFARACRARLLAETEATPHAMAARFFQEFGETPTQMNAILKKYGHDAATDTGGGGVRWREWRGEGLLADMIYHGLAAALLADPLVKKVDFGLNECGDTLLKIELSLLTPDQQREKLIDDLAHHGEPILQGQLLIDLGRPEVIKLLTAKLQDVMQNRTMYPLGASSNLSYVLFKAGDTSQPNLYGLDKFEIHQFRHDE